MKIGKDNSLHLKSLLSQFILPVTDPLEVRDSPQLWEQNCGPEESPKRRLEVLWSFQGFTQKSLNQASGYSDFIQGDSVGLPRESSSVKSVTLLASKCFCGTTAFVDVSPWSF